MKKVVMSVVLAGALFALPSISEASFKSGDRGDGVRELQIALADQGFDGGTQGIFGPKTLAAVQGYQLANGISSPRGNFYGVAGPQTLSSLGISSSNSGSSSASASSSNTSSGSTGAISNSNSSQASTSSSVSAIISTARGQIGAPYQWGGTTPAGFDCSGFINYAFSQNGKSIPRTVAQMYSAATTVSNPQPGDIVFFETRTGPSHAGIYLGNGDFIHSGTSTGVTISNLNSNPYWSNAYLSAGRL